MMAQNCAAPECDDPGYLPPVHQPGDLVFCMAHWIQGQVVVAKRAPLLQARWRELPARQRDEIGPAEKYLPRGPQGLLDWYARIFFAERQGGLTENELLDGLATDAEELDMFADIAEYLRQARQEPKDGAS